MEFDLLIYIAYFYRYKSNGFFYVYPNLYLDIVGRTSHLKIYLTESVTFGYMYAYLNLYFYGLPNVISAFLH